MNVIQTNSTKEYSVESGVKHPQLTAYPDKTHDCWETTGFAFENERGSFIEFSCEGQLLDIGVSEAVFHYLASKKSVIDAIGVISWEPKWKENLLSQFDKAIAKQLQREADEFWLR